MRDFVLIALQTLQWLIEFFGWWIALGVIWYSFEPNLGTKAVLVTGFGALMCFFCIRILINRLY